MYDQYDIWSRSQTNSVLSTKEYISCNLLLICCCSQLYFQRTQIYTGATSEELTAYPSEHLCSPPVYSVVYVTPSLVFCLMFCMPLFVLFSFSI